MEVGGNSETPLAEYTFGRLRHTGGTVSILEAGSHLPPEVVVATALVIEAIWRRCRLARINANKGNTGPAASVSDPVSRGNSGSAA